MTEALKQAALGSPPASPFAVSYLQLCQISYSDPSQIPALVAQVTPLGDGHWSCAWGPATDPDDANLVYVAVYTDAPSGLPILAAVVIRGTDVDVPDTWGILKQGFEDLFVPWQSPLPWLIDNPARVADGTLDALDAIAGLTAGGASLQDYLIGFLGDPANAGPLLVVTGHSLGGCLTTVAAPWLTMMIGANGLSTPVVPATFAAPTAGNAAFAAYFEATFNYGLRAFNSLDIVPMAWANLDGIKTAYEPCGISVPDLVWLGVEGFKALLAATGATYAQPATNLVPLTGSCQPTAKADDWYEEALIQHKTTTYMALLGGASIVDETLLRPPARASLSRRRAIRMRRRATLKRPNLDRSIR
jgi:hypothetical protein